ncbi:Cadherin EGF LAG seven-pass G-type receptor 1 [Goodea atripinnis]|uniref:Cadherin EGF LAG seven-pass G-type receptor 1 n=1 Tax=Goodea atripinnis TaxID=208336 RepID=A0ABV0PWN5_9TELE
MRNWNRINLSPIFNQSFQLFQALFSTIHTQVGYCDRCEFNRRQSRCVPGVCRNGGTCREHSGGGFDCVCPPGGYEGPYCTVSARSFPPKSFAMFRGLRQRFHLSISLRSVD